MAGDTCALLDDIRVSDQLGWEGQGTVSETGCALFDDVHGLIGVAQSEPKVVDFIAPETAVPEPAVSQQAQRHSRSHDAVRLQACGQPIKAGSCTTPITVICCLSTPCFREPMPLSYLMPFDFAEDRSNPAEIEAHVLMRGGHFVTWGTRVALAVLKGKPDVLLLDGPAAGRYMWLSRSGIGHRCSIWDPIFQDLTDAIVPPAPDTKQSGQVFDLAGGEARLRNVMQLILE